LAKLNTEVSEYNLEWPEEEITKMVKAKVDEDVHPEAEFLERFEAYVKFEHSKSTMLDELAAKVKDAKPMIQSGATGAADYFMLGNFTTDDLTAKCGKPLNEVGITPVPTNSVDKNTVICVSLRDGLIATNVKEVEQMAKIYKRLKAIPRPDRFPDLDAHLMPGWEKLPELVSKAIIP